MGSDLVASLQLLIAHIQLCNDKCAQIQLINDGISFVTLYFRLESACRMFHSLDMAHSMIGFHTNSTYVLPCIYRTQLGDECACPNMWSCMEKPEDVFVAELCTQSITLFGTLPCKHANELTFVIGSSKFSCHQKIVLSKVMVIQADPYNKIHCHLRVALS